MKMTAAILVLFALLVCLPALYYFWTGFVETGGIETVWQQIAHGVAATALFALASVALLAAAVVQLERLGDEITTTRHQLQDEFHRRRYEK